MKTSVVFLNSSAYNRQGYLRLFERNEEACLILWSSVVMAGR